MMTVCNCGMPFEQVSHARYCTDCGAQGCGSCALTIDAITYCRWCAVSLAPASM